MKKTFFIYFLVLMSAIPALAQDLIVLKSGEDIEVKVLEVNENEVSFKKFNNLEGPTYTAFINDVFFIKFEDGTKRVFESVKEVSLTNTPSKLEMQYTPTELYQMGQRDARKFYRARNSGAGWIAATNILLSPLVGLIPAIVVSIGEPQFYNLDFPDSELIKNENYYRGYMTIAHKKKSKRIWGNYIVSAGFNIVLVAILL